MHRSSCRQPENAGDTRCTHLIVVEQATINDLLAQAAVAEKRITGERLRLDM